MTTWKWRPGNASNGWLVVPPLIVVAGIALLARLVSPAGLTASILTSNGQMQALQHSEAYDEPSTSSVDRLAALIGQREIRLRWDGFLFCRASGEYEFVVSAAANVRLWVDAKILLQHEPAGRVTDTARRLPLTRGQHLISLEYERGNQLSNLQLRWDGGSAHRLAPIQASALSPSSLTLWRWRFQESLPTVVGGLGSLWTVWVIVAIARIIRRAAPFTPAPLPGPVACVLAACGLLFLSGIWWGWPGPGWAPDEIDPPTVLDALSQHFSNGDKYPPTQYYALTLFYAPFLVAERAHLISASSTQIRDFLFMQGRLLSFVMALGVLRSIALLYTRVVGDQRAWMAALCAGLFLPFVYYAKTANLDVPYLFWFVLSLVLLAEIHHSGHPRDFAAFGVTAALAITTKDQAYGLYVLPCAHLIAQTTRSGRNIKGLLYGTLAGAATFGLCHNILFNYPGFVGHVRALSSAAGYRMFPPTLAGQVTLARTTAGQLFWAMGWPGVLASLLGLTVASRRGERFSPPLWLLLAPVSYYLTFLCVVGYVYDRFLLPVTTILAIAAAVGLGRLLDGWPRRSIGRPAAAIMIAWLVLRAWSVDALLMRDSRYTAEAWLRGHIQGDETVATVDMGLYSPRLDEFRLQRMSPTIDDALIVKPDFIVINSEFTQRLSSGSSRSSLQTWLESGAGPYVEAYRHKESLRWSLLRWDDRFMDRVEDPFTNLDKANPEIVIFRRR